MSEQCRDVRLMFASCLMFQQTCAHVCHVNVKLWPMWPMFRCNVHRIITMCGRRSNVLGQMFMLHLNVFFSDVHMLTCQLLLFV